MAVAARKKDVSLNDPNKFAWYIVKVIANYERKVKTLLDQKIEALGLQDVIQEVFIAEYEEQTLTSKNKPKVVTKNHYSQYVFVKAKLSNEVWGLIRNVRGVTGWCGEDKNKPLEISEKEITDIKRMCGIDVDKEARERQRSIAQEFAGKPGDKVIITGGVFASYSDLYECKIESIDKRRGNVKLIMNGMIPLELPITDVQII